MKLYRYYDDCGRMGAIEGLLFLTDEQLERYREYSNVLYWDELLGKHSEGTYDFSDETLTLIDISEDVAKVLYKAIGDQVLSGPFDLDYFDEVVAEHKEMEEDDSYDDGDA